jgi:hypothetical protein
MAGKRAIRTRSISRRPYKKKATPKPRFKLMRSPNYPARPVSTRATLKYCDYGIQLDPAVGTAAVRVFNANGLFDPDFAFGGHQPAGFDQYMALYHEYVVLGSTIKVWAVNGDATSAQIIWVSLEDYPASSVDLRQYIENGNTVWTMLDNASGASPSKVLNHRADIAKFSTQKILNEDSFAGNASRNPDDSHYFHVGVASHSPTYNATPVTICVEITYDVIFRDPALTDLS